MSDTTGRTGVALPSRVRVGDRPKAATINSLIDVLGDRRVTLGSMPFRQTEVRGCIRAAATLPMVTSYARWTQEYTTNADVLAVVDEGTYDEIFAYVAGVYHMDIYVDFSVSSSEVSVEVINADDITVGSFLFRHSDYACDACAGNITLGEIDGRLSASFDLLAIAGEHWRVLIDDTAPGLTFVKWNVHLVQAYEAP